MRSPTEQLFTGMLMLAVILMAWTQSSHATLRIIENAIEATTADVRLPMAPFGLLSVRGCAACPPRVLRVTDQTRYQVAGQDVDLAEFRAEAGEPAFRDGMIVVFYAPDTDRIIRLTLHAPSPGGGRQ